MLAIRGSVPPLLTAVSLASIVASWRFWRWSLRLYRRLVQYEDAETPAVVLRYSPELRVTIGIDEYLQLVEETLHEFEVLFGGTLKARPTVVLIPTRAEMQDVWGMNLLGVAFGTNIVLICTQGAEQDPTRRELLRHEVVHLFAAEWRSRNAIRLLQERLAVHLEGREGLRSADFEALRDQLAAAGETPGELFHNECFTAEWSENYPTAGSFVGFLIREWGWERFRECYVRSEPENWNEVFQEVYKTDLLAASKAWLAQLTARAGEFEPELSTAVRLARISAAYERGDYPDCVEQAEQLGSEPVPSMICWQIAEALCRLGQYARAVEFQHAALGQDEDPIDTEYRGTAWLRLGQFLDQLGRRSEALVAYDAVLHAPEKEAQGAVRAWARRFRSSPCSGRDLYLGERDTSSNRRKGVSS